MIYTYEISLNGSDYLSLYPTNHPKITTEKMANDYVWRSEVDVFKINESLNETVYGLLETWFDTAAAFNYTNRIQIKKSGTVKYTFEFGIKRGKLNIENKYYEISPEPLDVYTDILYYKNRNVTRAHGTAYHYNDEDEIAADTVDKIYGAEMVFFKDYVETGAASMLGVLNGLSTRVSDYSAQSAFLWNDLYPDGSSPGGTDNYVSSDANHLQRFAVARDSSNTNLVTSINDVLNMPKAFQCFWYCASDWTIHFEHVRWFEEQIADSQLDISGSDYYDDARIFEYSTPEIFNTENFYFPTDNEEDDYDDVQIIYDPNFVNYSSEKVDWRVEYDAFLSSDFLDLSMFMAIGVTELAVGYKNDPDGTGGWTTFTTDGADCTEGVANGADNIAYTNFMMKDVGETMDYVIDVTYSGGVNNKITVRGYTAGSPTGPAAVDLDDGLNSASITGDNLEIRSTGNQDFTYTMAVTADNTYRIPWEDGAISSDSLQNNYLAWANIIDRWWLYSRFAENGYYNEGSETTFESVKYNKEQDIFSFYNAADIDPMRGITTDYGTGMILSMTRDLETDFITVKLRYNE